MLSRLLPPNIYEAVSSAFNLQNVYELRLRENKPLAINFGGKMYFVKNIKTSQNIICSSKDIEYVLLSASENSLYAVNNQICQGFLTCDGGIRIGVAGEHILTSSGETKTIKNISSINIRIPHEIKNCAHTALTFIANGGIKSALILAPPGAGKTTFLRDLANSIGQMSKVVNILICDERYEIANSANGKISLGVGQTADVISGATKKYVFEQGIRTLKPDLIICDEIMNEEDACAIIKAIRSGVSVIATAHSGSIVDAKSRSDLKMLLDQKAFERIIVLSSRNGPGTYEAIYNASLEIVYKSGEF